MDQALNQKIDAFIAANKEQLLKDIAALVAINSVESTPAEGAPFGLGARAALDKTLELAAGKILPDNGKIFLYLSCAVPFRGKGAVQNRKHAKIAASFPWAGFTAHTLAGGDV